jgi:hypothetical protein
MCSGCVFGFEKASHHIIMLYKWFCVRENPSTTVFCKLGRILEASSSLGVFDFCQ